MFLVYALLVQLDQVSSCNISCFWCTPSRRPVNQTLSGWCLIATFPSFWCQSFSFHVHVNTLLVNRPSSQNRFALATFGTLSYSDFLQLDQVNICKIFMFWYAVLVNQTPSCARFAFTFSESGVRPLPIKSDVFSEARFSTCNIVMFWYALLFKHTAS